MILSENRYPPRTKSEGKLFREHALRQVAAQHERVRGRLAAARIVGGAAADVAEAGATVQAARRRVVLVDFEKDRRRAEAGEPAQMQVEQLARKPAPASGRRDRDRQDL